MINKDLKLDKYKKIALGYFDYKKDEVFLDDFINEEFVIEWILNVAGEADQGITESGVHFIKEYYGNDYIINKVLAKEPSFPFDSKDPFAFLKEQLNSD